VTWISSKQALPANCMISIYLHDYNVTQCPSILLHILLREMTVLRGTLSHMTSLNLAISPSCWFSLGLRLCTLLKNLFPILTIAQFTVPFWSIQQSHIIGPSVLLKIGPCHVSPRPMSSRSNMWQCQNSKTQLRNRLSQQVFAYLASRSFRPSQFATKCIQNCHFEAIWALPSVKFSRSLAVRVKVLNWSKVSQSQVCVKLIEMVQ